MASTATHERKPKRKTSKKPKAPKAKAPKAKQPKTPKPRVHKAPQSPAKKYQYEIACKFNGASAGVEAAKIGVTIPASQLSLTKAGVLFTNSQLDCMVEYDPNSEGDISGQTSFDSMRQEDRVIATANVVGFSVKTAGYSFSLQMPKSSVDLSKLGKTAGMYGRLCINKIGVAKSKVIEPDEGDPGQAELGYD